MARRRRTVLLAAMLIVVAASVSLCGCVGGAVPAQEPQKPQEPPKIGVTSPEDPTMAQSRSGRASTPLIATTHWGATTGWLLTEDGLRRTTTGAADWLNVSPKDLYLDATRNSTYRYSMIGGSSAWLALAPDNHAANLAIYHTADGGRIWNASLVAGANLANATPLDLYFVDERHGFLLVDEQGIAMGREMVSLYSTADGGSRWTQVSRSDPNDAVDGSLPCVGVKSGIAFIDAERGWLAGRWNGDGAYIYATEDGGSSWWPVDLTIPSGFSSEGGAVDTFPPLLFDSGRGLLPVCIHPERALIFFVTSDNGETWEPTPHIPSYAGGLDFCWSFSDADHGWASDGARLLATADGARTWAGIEPDSVLDPLVYAGFRIYQLSFSGSETGWAVLKPKDGEGAGFRLLATADGGRSWTDLGEVWKAPSDVGGESDGAPPTTIIELPGTLQELGRCFAYADERGHAALYDMDTRNPVWSGELELAPHVSLSWSPDGTTLAYWCRAGDPETTYMAFLSLDECARSLVELTGLGSWDFDMGASMSWSPSSRFLSIETASYPPCPVTIVDRSTMEIVAHFACISGPCWSPDETQFAYSDIEGKYFGGGGFFSSHLVIHDVAAGEETVPVRGESDFSMSPVEWTEDGAVVYAYYKAEVPTRWLDTAGREHKPPDSPDPQPTNSSLKPQGFPEDLGRIVQASRDPDTGDWLVAVSSVGEPVWLYLYREGEDPVRLIKGSKPVWRVGGAGP